MAETIKVSEANIEMRARQGMLGAVDVPWTDDFALDEAQFRRRRRPLDRRLRPGRGTVSTSDSSAAETGSTPALCHGYGW